MKKGLYIVATPIGNIKDISERAISILREVDYVACEDTRVTKKLFGLLGIGLNKKFVPLHDYNEQEKSQSIIDYIVQNNKSVALVSDAGSPLISDPGYKLVRLCKEQNVATYTIPGCCAIICALQLSGLPTNRFMFAGFLPNKEKARQDTLNELKNIDASLVFYESAPRLLKSLNAIKDIYPNREVSVVREITKMFEEARTSSATDLIDYYSNNPPKGEIVIVVAPPVLATVCEVDVEKILKEKMLNLSLKQAVAETVAEYGLNKNQVYGLAIRIKDEA